MNPISKLGVGPMSSEVIESVFKYSAERGVPLMLIASKNQIDWDGGYVNRWNTNDYMAYVREMRKQYPRAKVYVCRDHCGPGFKNNDLHDVYQTIDSDLENGFDFMHVDFCHYKGTRKDILEQSKKAIVYIREKAPNILLEVGTDENKGDFLTNLAAIEEEMKFLTALGPLNFFVFQTGSLVKEVNQAGKFNHSFLEAARPLAEKYKVSFKEHNCDYLSVEDVETRKGLVDAMNVAPQYGHLQTMVTLQKAFLHGVDASEFINDAYASKKWGKWLQTATPDNVMLCAVIAGHYVFANDSYKWLYERVSKYEDLRGSIINEMMKNYDIYVKNL